MYIYFEIGLLYLAGISMPGPSMLLVIYNSFLSIKSSIFVTLGVSLGIAIQSGLILIGMNILPIEGKVYNSLLLICSSFLIILGIKTVFDAKQKRYGIDRVERLPLSKFKCFSLGLSIELVNPIALTFFFSIFLGKINQITFIWLIWIEIVILGILFFMSLVFIAHKVLKKNGEISNRIMMLISGVLFIAYGVNMLYSLQQNIAH